MHVCELNRAGTCVLKIVFFLSVTTVSSSSRTKLGDVCGVFVTKTG